MTDIISPKIILLSLITIFALLGGALTPLNSITWTMNNVPLIKQITQYILFALFIYAIYGGDILNIIISSGIAFIIYLLLLQIDMIYFPSTTGLATTAATNATSSII